MDRQFNLIRFRCDKRAWRYRALHFIVYGHCTALLLRSPRLRDYAENERTSERITDWLVTGCSVGPRRLRKREEKESGRGLGRQKSTPDRHLTTREAHINIPATHQLHTGNTCKYARSQEQQLSRNYVTKRQPLQRIQAAAGGSSPIANQSTEC